MNAPQVHQTTLRKKDDVTTRSHGVSIYLRFHVRDRFGISFEPSYVNLNVEVTNAIYTISTAQTASRMETYLQTMASSGITAK